MKNNRGFTFIELIIIIAIIGILVSIVIPKISTNNLEMKIYGKNISSDLRYIRHIRMTEGKPYRIILNEKYYKVLDGPKVIKVVNLNNNTKIVHNFKNNQIRFTYNGSPSGSGGTINIVNKANNNYMSVTIVPCTGRIHFINKLFKGFQEIL